MDIIENRRLYSRLDHFFIGASRALDTLFVKARSSREYPATDTDHGMSARDRTLAGRYMRVNHVGEVCAQALYQSQACTARNESTRGQMQQAAAEEIDHLAWCERRLDELGNRKSILNPLWYGGAFAIGALSGMAGDKWNLGFVAETEKQVVAHLDDHLGRLPDKDSRSRQVVSQMRVDEAGHAKQAVNAGATELPTAIKKLMALASAVMTGAAYWI